MDFFDICIVCALYKEAKAVLDEIAARYTVSFVRAFSRNGRYEYRCTTIYNNKGEPLTVLVTWLTDSGPVQIGLDLQPLLLEFHPRFAAMAGLCAGYGEKVNLGDLVVAEYAYHYEEGKILIGSDGQPKIIPEMRTHDTISRVIHYVKGFEAWKEPVTEMKRDRLKRQELTDSEQPQCYIAPMASSMAVREDNPFPWLIEYRNRKTIALDMEAATFYLTLRSFPDIHALVVKGVCDHADMRKDDTYHDYAARASAIYLLSFIHEYVTEETMPTSHVQQQAPSRLFSNMLANDMGEVRLEGAKELGRLKNPCTVQVIISHLKIEPEPYIRHWLAYALGQIGGELAFKALQEAKTKETHWFAQKGIDTGLQLIQNGE